MLRVDAPHIAEGPPWISSASGYFFTGSKSGGVMIQPWIVNSSEG